MTATLLRWVYVPIAVYSPGSNNGDVHQSNSAENQASSENDNNTQQTGDQSQRGAATGVSGGDHESDLRPRPAGTPPAIVSRIHAEVARYLQSEEGRKELISRSLEPAGDGPAAFAEAIRRDADLFKDLAARLKIKAE